MDGTASHVADPSADAPKPAAFFPAPGGDGETFTRGMVWTHEPIAVAGQSYDDAGPIRIRLTSSRPRCERRQRLGLRVKVRRGGGRPRGQSARSSAASGGDDGGGSTDGEGEPHRLDEQRPTVNLLWVEVSA